MAQQHLNSWRLTIIDSATLKGIDRATATVDDKVYITGAQGIVFINKIPKLQSTGIKITCVGYRALEYKIKDKCPDTLRLSASINNLKEISINSVVRKVILADVDKVYEGGYYPGPNEEVVQFIPNADKISGIIASIECKSLHNNDSRGKAFKINIYAKSDGDVYPEGELIKDSIIVYNNAKLPVIEVDITKYNIQLPATGFFIGFETLSRNWYDTRLLKSKGIDQYRIPGLQGTFKNKKWTSLSDAWIPPSNTTYVLTRKTSDYNTWVIQKDVNFALGATIIKD
ncbi:hypothetical protein SAMN05192574_109154 [Mucilaginibacter gossypiicola]|uniref:CarboxypepD_reg-like domain-containing protein n=2 Tax=Mucilaginibacter gossypiicola TaxID=551995 RepID=A0A1H8QU59_9SPHI|nr:hypothetical protein SAMN05192574_109154 [Mucilaginibacter gossypiicola]